MDRVVKGRIRAHGAPLRAGWIAVEGDRIAAIGTGSAPSATQTDDHGDALIFPGVIDGQTHATSYRGFDGIAETTRAAVAGGVTTLVDMPYDNPLPLDRAERLAAKRDAILANAHADMALYGTVTRETGINQLEALIEGGVVAFKISSFESSPSRFPRIPADLMLDLLEALAPTSLPVGLHNEDQEIVLARMARALADGSDGIYAHAWARPEASELAATGQFFSLGFATGAHSHAVHLSSGAGFRMTRQYADLPMRATGELCVHYLWFDAARDGGRLGARMKVNPPIRAGAIEGLWKAVETGQVAFVSSDHSSWPIDNKLTASIFEAGAGVPGIETLLPAFYTGAGRRGLDAPALTQRLLCEAPARFFGLDDRKGRIAPGLDADLVVVEEGAFPWNEAVSHDGLAWSPFHGETFDIRVAATYLRGALAWDGTEVCNSAGSGCYVRRGSSSWFDQENSAA